MKGINKMSHNIVNNYASTMITIFDQTIKGYEGAKDTIKNTEAQLQDIQHEIEISKPKDMYSGYLMYQKIRELRIQRREAKEEVELLQELYDYLTGQQAQQFKQTMQKIQGHSAKLRTQQENRTYSPRERKDLTIEGVTSTEPKPFEEMMEEFKKPIMILEGTDFYSGFINPNAIRGTMASIAIDFGISIIPTRNAQDTAAMIKRIAVREQNGERTPIQIRTDKKPVSLLEQQLFIVESLPNIGPVNAKNLLQHFGSVANVLNASETELQEVEGIGKKTAENIRKVIDSKYLYFQKEIKEKKLL